MYFLLSWSFHSSSWFSFLWCSSTSTATERGLLWKAALGVSGPTTCTEEYFTSSSSMALQWKQGNMAYMNPLGLILSAFSPETMLCCNTDDISSPGCWEKLRQGDWLLFVGGYMVFHNLRKVTQKGKKSVSDIQKKTKKKRGKSRNQEKYIYPFTYMQL